jgi:hypothetical protein
VNFVWDGDKPKGLFIKWHGREKFGCFPKQKGEIFKIFQGIIILAM